MDKKRLLWMALSGMLVVGLLLTATLPRGAGAAQALSAVGERLSSPARPMAASLSGAYIGTVELDYAVPGEYDDDLNPPVPGDDPLPALGNIDFGLQLTDAGEGAMEGYVDLEHTLVFTTTHTVGATDFGPIVTGSFDGDDLVLESERVSLVSAGQRLMRQFRLTGSVAEDNPLQITGEYRETVWGYGPQPATVVGRFTLDRISAAATNFVFMPMINNK